MRYHLCTERDSMNCATERGFRPVDRTGRRRSGCNQASSSRRRTARCCRSARTVSAPAVARIIVPAMLISLPSMVTEEPECRYRCKIDGAGAGAEMIAILPVVRSIRLAAGSVRDAPSAGRRRYRARRSTGSQHRYRTFTLMSGASTAGLKKAHDWRDGAVNRRAARRTAPRARSG